MGMVDAREGGEPVGVRGGRAAVFWLGGWK
jgi:hypothetical protein